jgi:hypothetical protein
MKARAMQVLYCMRCRYNGDNLPLLGASMLQHVSGQTLHVDS